MRPSRRGLGIVGLSIAVATGAASPLSALAATRWVAKDGTAGPAACSGTKRAAKTIQAAITASVAGDTVVVCAGTYRERLVIGGTRDRLVVRAATTGTAIIRTPAAQSNVVTIDSVDDAVLQGFAISVDTVAPCQRQNQVVMVQNGALRASLRALTITPRGTATMGSCGLARGVQVTSGSTATLKGSTIRDAQTDAAYAEGAGARITVEGSTLRFLHATAAFPSFCNGWLVRARLGAALAVKGSTLAGKDTAGVTTPLACAGVTLEDGGAAAVRTTTISDVNSGVQILGGTGPVVTGVTVNSGRGTNGNGIYLANVTNGTVSGVTVHQMSQAGIWLTAATNGTSVTSSDATGNAGPDCRDDATGTNSWSGVKGTDDIPDSICTP